MEYKEIRNSLEKMMRKNYRDFVKALIGLETKIEDEGYLDEIYDKYMDADAISLLNEDFNLLIKRMQE